MKKVTKKKLKIKKEKIVLYDADPKCDHELDENSYSGIRCKKCSGWFCF